jgi:SAM-dependent methyltransferase
MINMGERVLYYLSKSVTNDGIKTSDQNAWDIENSLWLLTKEYPNFDQLVKGKRIVDYGCGLGYQSIALCMKYYCYVVGIDTNTKVLNFAIELADSKNIPRSKLIFKNGITEDMIKGFDIVISQNSFEHFRDPADVLWEMQNLLKDLGKILITFGPPWFAPYGSHMHFFCKIPWINILFSENAVMRVRAHYRNDGANRYEDVESGLNKMTITKFEKIISESRLNTLYKRYNCTKGINILSKVPLLREMFVNHISVILAK